MRAITLALAGLLCMIAGENKVFSQAEVSGWGNLRGLRVSGQLVAFTTAVGIYSPDFSQLTLSQREGPTYTTQYVRDGNTVTVGANLQIRPAGRGGTAPSVPIAPQNGRRPTGGINYTISYTDMAAGRCDVKIKLSSPVAQAIGGIYYFVTLPSANFTDGAAELIGGSSLVSASLASPDAKGRYLAGAGTGIRFSGKNHAKIEASFGKSLDVVVQKGHGRGGNDIQAYFPLVVGPTVAGQVAEAEFSLKADMDVDGAPAIVSLDPSNAGGEWLGIGGNYRIQNSRLDPLHIQYILDNMRVAYGRVALPWNLWQPKEDAPPPALAERNGPRTAPSGGRGGMNSIAPSVEIARKLAKQNIPLIISCWSPPSWATLPNQNAAQRGQRLDPAKWDAICQSIGSYLVYLKDRYGVEPELFSFNESNVGINVRQSPEEHAEGIKKLGAYFQSIGLKTRMLLGDTGDALPINFIQPALNDPEAVAYIGAVSFHSWRGATDAQYQKWADAAAQLGVPLIDAEGGNDAQAANYPDIFREPWYALDEAAEYVRIMRICQPQAILEWQFTENYSVLFADGDGKLQPTQRFYNLKQFNLGPAGSTWIPAQSNNDAVLPAALRAPQTGAYFVHLVNNGPSRPVMITGLPGTLTAMNVYVTNQSQGMTRIDPVQLNNGSARFTLQGLTLTTLVSPAP